MAANEISLGFPDSQTVTVFLDGKHVATMTNAPGYEDGIPVELFDLMRAAPEMLAALKAEGRRTCRCKDFHPYKCVNCERWAVIDKAEGRIA